MAFTSRRRNHRRDRSGGLAKFLSELGSSDQFCKSTCTNEDVFGFRLDAVDQQTAIALIDAWAQERQGRTVCLCNVHSVVTAWRFEEFAEALKSADLALPDGAPLAWVLRLIGNKGQKRVAGPDLMWEWCKHATSAHSSIYLCGSTPEILHQLETNLENHFPLLNIAGSHSPPFKPLTEQEDQDLVDTINASGAGIVWIAFGCPKQEIWMHAHRGRVKPVMVGVGAAFDFHAGAVKRAPLWAQQAGLEWAYRLMRSPSYLWRRYIFNNPLFVGLIAWNLSKRAMHSIVSKCM